MCGCVGLCVAWLGGGVGVCVWCGWGEVGERQGWGSEAVVPLLNAVSRQFFKQHKRINCGRPATDCHEHTWDSSRDKQHMSHCTTVCVSQRSTSPETSTACDIPRASGDSRLSGATELCQHHQQRHRWWCMCTAIPPLYWWQEAHLTFQQ